ncbi:UspA domain protein [Halorhodospira halochloris]|uniref:UspA domain protein n=1 Tax=Halorhodospira halochloris TaxID=1052 RepID=A0A110B593_HALHR|nr:universal stress protein [Halorhodospira halochloris]MCG5548710.1 universal stress protein [Halorhodospira halochloris]BAU57850.1 UspA domain protein [Halorhodospira halochloris]
MVNEYSPKRVVVLIDASRNSLEALNTAIDIACHWQTELLALFIEEEDLLRCAAYPWAREIGLSGAVRKIDRNSLEESMRHRAEEARRALNRCAGSRQIKWQLHVSRGRVIPETLQKISADDFLILGRVGYARTRGLRLGSTARAVTRQAPGPVMVWEQPVAGRQTQLRAALLIEADSTSHSGLETLRLAHAMLGEHETLATVVVEPENDSELIDKQLRPWLLDHYPRARLISTTDIDAEQIAGIVADDCIGKLILSRRSQLIHYEAAELLVDRLRIPLLVLP